MMRHLITVLFCLAFHTSAYAANFLCVSPNGTRDGADYFQLLVTDYKIEVKTGRGTFALNPQDFVVRNHNWIFVGASEFPMMTAQGSQLMTLENFTLRLLGQGSQVELSYQFAGDGYWNLFEGNCQPIHPARVCKDLL